MKVKKYVVDSMPAAMQKIRVDLGEHAVILNTKEVKTGGWFGFFGKRQFEVIAAAPGEEKAKADAQRTAAPKAAVSAAPAPAAAPEPAPAPDTQAVIKELQGMKEMLIGLISGEQGQERIPKPLLPWVQRLKEQEVDQAVIHYLVEQVLRAVPVSEQTREEVCRVLLDQTQKLIAEGSMYGHQIERTVNLVSFVGPTGVGKTTTIAKLAAEQLLHHGRRVGLLTTDTYRIAAVEQLKTYANILNVPVETVFSPDGLKKAVKNLKDCDLIFMDTTGRNFQDLQYIQEIGKYLAEPLVQENYLVLSMTAKYSDMKRIVDNFRDVAVDKIILTKMDETSSYGSILNLAYHYPYPLTYITTGQSVPEDIVKIVPEQLAKLMLGVTGDDDGSSAAS